MGSKLGTRQCSAGIIGDKTDVVVVAAAAAAAAAADAFTTANIRSPFDV